MDVDQLGQQDELLLLQEEVQEIFSSTEELGLVERVLWHGQEEHLLSVEIYNYKIADGLRQEYNLN